MKSPQAQRPIPSTVPASRESRRNLFLGVLLFAVTLLVYGQAWGFGFIIVDDSAYVTANPYVLGGVTLRGLIWSFTTFHDSNWIPFTWISLMLDSSIYGNGPGGYHLTNLLLHATNTVLVFLVFTRATHNATRSAFVAALFALHPLHVESVAWIAERKDVLSTLFGLLALLRYVRYAAGSGRGNLVASLLFFVASLLSKQTLVTLPFVFLLLDFWPLQRLSFQNSVSPERMKPPRSHRGAGPIVVKNDDHALSGGRRPVVRLIVEKLPFFAASVVFSMMAMLAQSKSGAVMPLVGFSFASRCTNAVFVYAAYLGKALFPQNLAIYYPHPHESLSWATVGLAAALLVAISATAVVCIRRYPFLFVGWCWYLGTLVPMIGLVQIGGQQMADRYTYFPLIGIFLAATWLVPELVPAGFLRTRVLPAAALASVLLLAATAYSQISYWHDSVTLLRHSMECTPDNSVAHEFLGGAYVSEGDLNEGVKELEKAIGLAPSYAPLHESLGSALLQLGRLDEAVAQYREALALDERLAQAHADLGLILFNRGQIDEAKAHDLRAIELDPNLIAAQVNLAVLCLAANDYAGAIAHSERALELNPGVANSHVCIAIALRQQGRLDEAVSHLQQAIEIAPNEPVARDELNRTLAMKQNVATPGANEPANPPGS